MEEEHYDSPHLKLFLGIYSFEMQPLYLSSLILTDTNTKFHPLDNVGMNVV
jgi:ribosomal protein L27